MFLNFDTEILDGTLGGLVAALAARQAVGLAGVRQVDVPGVATARMRAPGVSRSERHRAAGVALRTLAGIGDPPLGQSRDVRDFSFGAAAQG